MTCVVGPQKLTTIRLFLIRLVLAVGHAVAGQAVVDAVAVTALEVVNASTRNVQR